MDKKAEIFVVKATRCKRCGGILLSEFGLKNGMGHICKKKADAEAARALENRDQVSFFETKDVYTGNEN